MRPATTAFIDWVDKNLLLHYGTPFPLSWEQKQYLKELMARDVYLEIAKTIVKELSPK